MDKLTLLEASEMRVKLKGLEKQIESGELSLLERCEIEDEILEIKEALGEFERGHQENENCENCSG